jgi:hypothetical protein
VQPDDLASGEGRTPLTPASLVNLYEKIADHTNMARSSGDSLTHDAMVVRRETVVGAGVMAFRGEARSSSALGPKTGTSLLFSWPLGGSVGLTVEPSVGGRALRLESSVFSELAGEVRETLTGRALGGSSSWQVTSWQKGRFLSEPLSTPAYLEPGRVEAGISGQVALPLHSKWQLEAQGGADGVRYEPPDWRVLDRQGLNAALGVAWRGASRTVKLTMLGSHHGFPHALAEWETRREDNRIGVEITGSLEGSSVVRVSLGGLWNRSAVEAYDFRSERAALILSAPWGRGSVQGYAALAHQVYSNPGPEEARVAPSDRDSGSVISIQYSRPLNATHTVIVRSGWSRSQTGFRDDFYERFETCLYLTFRGT